MTDPDQRRAFREFVLRHHPDRGGDPDTFAAGLAAFEAGRRQTGTVVFHRRRRGPARVLQRLRQRRARRAHPRVR